jgi:hypothetical protein
MQVVVHNLEAEMVEEVDNPPGIGQALLVGLAYNHSDIAL